jgi:hypothetical protein
MYCENIVANFSLRIFRNAKLNDYSQATKYQFKKVSFLDIKYYWGSR